MTPARFPAPVGFCGREGRHAPHAGSDGSTFRIDPSACTITGYSAKPVGDKVITIEYAGQTAQFKVTVKYVWRQYLIRIFLLGFIWY